MTQGDISSNSAESNFKYDTAFKVFIGLGTKETSIDCQ